MGRSARTPAALALLLARYAVKCCVATLLPTALYAALATQHAAWAALVAWWRPWSNAALFAALTTLVHEGLYFGASLPGGASCR